MAGDPGFYSRAESGSGRWTLCEATSARAEEPRRAGLDHLLAQRTRMSEAAHGQTTWVQGVSCLLVPSGG